MADAVFRLVYRSQLTVDPEHRKTEIADILDASRRKNEDRNITGALLIWQDYVVQTLEGDENEVRGLYDKIAADSRHEAVTLLEAQQVDGRTFARWSMARIAESDQPSGIPTLTNKHDDVDPSAETRESDPVVTAMRGYARGNEGFRGQGASANTY